MMTSFIVFFHCCKTRLERHAQSVSCFVFGFSGERQFTRGGLGATPPDVFSGTALADPMLASLNITQLKNSETTTQNQRKQMNKPNNKKNQTQPSQLKQFLIQITLLSLTLSSTSCSTSQHRHDAAVRVLDQENIVLQALASERASSAVETKVSRDPALSRAEAHLAEAIKRLTESNQALRSEL